MARIQPLLDGLSGGTSQGAIGFCGTYLIEGLRRTVVDVGHAGRRRALGSALDRHGVRPGDIDDVVVTHTHWDHVQNLELFAGARILIHPAERRYARRPHPGDWATPGWTGAMLEREADRIVEVAEGYVIEPGVVVAHTPGHSVGSVSLFVETADGLCAVTGDAAQTAAAAVSGRNPVVMWSDHDARASIRRLVSTAEVFYPGHNPPFRLTRDRDVEFLRPPEVTFHGFPADLRWDDHETSAFVLDRTDEGADKAADHC